MVFVEIVTASAGAVPSWKRNTPTEVEAAIGPFVPCLEAEKRENANATNPTTRIPIPMNEAKRGQAVEVGVPA